MQFGPVQQPRTWSHWFSPEPGIGTHALSRHSRCVTEEVEEREELSEDPWELTDEVEERDEATDEREEPAEELTQV